MRIFTGAPVPEGADRVIIQEDVTRDGGITLGRDPGDRPAYPPRGADFAAGATLRRPAPAAPADIALLAAMNMPESAGGAPDPRWR